LSLVIFSDSTRYPGPRSAVSQTNKRLSGDFGHFHSQLCAFTKDCISP